MRYHERNNGEKRSQIRTGRPVIVKSEYEQIASTLTDEQLSTLLAKYQERTDTDGMAIRWAICQERVQRGV